MLDNPAQRGIQLGTASMSNDCKANRLLRLPQVLERIPVSKSHWWDGVGKGRYPQPVRFGARITCWKLEDIEQLAACGPRPNE